MMSSAFSHTLTSARTRTKKKRAYTDKQDVDAVNRFQVRSCFAGGSPFFDLRGDAFHAFQCSSSFDHNRTQREHQSLFELKTA